MTLEEIVGFLQENGLGVAGQSIFFAGLPEIPDDATSCWEYGGSAPAHVKGQQAPILEYPRVQILVRAKGYSEARTQAERIYRLLDGFSGVLGGVAYAQIRANQQPAFMDRDDKGRARIVANYSITKELSPLT